MKHNSFGWFHDEITSRELFNITIKRITCVTLFGMVTGFSFVSVLKVVCLLLAKSQKVLDTACQIEKYQKIKMYCMRLSCSLQKGRWYPYEPFFLKNQIGSSIHTVYVHEEKIIKYIFLFCFLCIQSIR